MRGNITEYRNFTYRDVEDCDGSPDCQWQPGASGALQKLDMACHCGTCKDREYKSNIGTLFLYSVQSFQFLSVMVTCNWDTEQVFAHSQASAPPKNTRDKIVKRYIKIYE